MDGRIKSPIELAVQVSRFRGFQVDRVNRMLEPYPGDLAFESTRFRYANHVICLLMFADVSLIWAA